MKKELNIHYNHLKRQYPPFFSYTIFVNNGLIGYHVVNGYQLVNG